MTRRLAGLLFITAALARAGSIQYTISNDVYNVCSRLYCTGGPYSLAITFDVPSKWITSPSLRVRLALELAGTLNLTSPVSSFRTGLALRSPTRP